MGEILHIYGPFAIQAYGIFLLAGIFISITLLLRHPLRKAFVTKEQMLAIVTWAIGAGLIGGRILYIVTESISQQGRLPWWEWFNIWEGGLSILGAISGILIMMVWFLYNRHMPLLPMLDLLSIYAPLTQAFGRIGCFFAGCCGGTFSTVPWAIDFLHPTQLYAALSSMLIFICMWFSSYRILHYQGQLCATYLMLASMQRFFLDFFRADRTILQHSPFTLDQWVAIGMGTFGITLFLLCTYCLPRRYEHF